VLGTTAAVALTAALYGCAASSPGIAATSASSAATTTTSTASPSAAPKSVVRHHGSRAPSRRLIASAALRRRTKSAGCRVLGALPDPACTPGGVFPHATVAEICTPGYAERVRAVLVSTKDAVYASYGISFHAAGRYQIDHLVPLEVGGNNTRANLWPQLTPGYGEKDTVENELHAAVCSGRIALATAQAQIAHDWRHAGVPVPTPSAAAPPSSSPSPAPSPAPATPAGFCSTHRCVASFSAGRGSIVQCADGQYSHSGGLPGVCSRHGGAK
jgi:hypothetical protein